jgi:hypothetical protein
LNEGDRVASGSVVAAISRDQLDHAAGGDMPLGKALHRLRVRRPAEEPLIPGKGGIEVRDSNTCENAIDGR